MEAERGCAAVTILPQPNRPVPERGDHVSMQSGTDLADCLRVGSSVVGCLKPEQGNKKHLNEE